MITIRVNLEARVLIIMSRFELVKFELWNPNLFLLFTTFITFLHVIESVLDLTVYVLRCDDCWLSLYKNSHVNIFFSVRDNYHMLKVLRWCKSNRILLQSQIRISSPFNWKTWCVNRSKSRLDFTMLSYYRCYLPLVWKHFSINNELVFVLKLS